VSKFKEVFSSAARAFAIAFGSSALILAGPVLDAADVKTAVALGIAALIASIAAGVKALQEYIPQISVGSYVKQPFGAWIDAFLQGGIGAFAVLLFNWLSAGDVTDWKNWIAAAAIGALQAGLRALQGAVTKGEDPAPATGF
jgi:hypothetical protein